MSPEQRAEALRLAVHLQEDCEAIRRDYRVFLSCMDDAATLLRALAAQSVQTEPLTTVSCDYPTCTKECGKVANYCHKTPKPAATVASARVGLTREQIDLAAHRLADVMDYPWEHMPAEGRRRMRENALAVLIAAGIPAPKE